MWTYQQSDGALTRDGASVAQGYAGHGAGLNNPAMEDVEGVGPLPCGVYAIGAPFNHPRCGPFSMRLTPDPGNTMYGRAGFLIHGDTPSMDHTASDGCVILPHDVREAIWSSGDTRLTVVSGLPAAAPVGEPDAPSA
jgi:hypothetical protein